MGAAVTTPRLLDVTRLISRAGLVQTGVDRVEAAYLRRILDDPIAFGLARTALGYVVINHDGLGALAKAIDSGDWGRPDVLSRMNRKLNAAAKLGQSFVRRHAIGRCRPNGLLKTLRRCMPPKFAYYNVGHSNISQRTILSVADAGGRSSVLIHDTIPLDWPEMQRHGTVAAFARKVAVVCSHADRVIVSTHSVAADLARHVTDIPPLVVAPLGVTVPRKEPISRRLDTESPYFVTVGTIEPRKNHALLLDIWDAWDDPPNLFVCGRRGWKNAAVFARLDAGVNNVTEVAELSDGQLASLVEGARALLFPSFAEGYGLPPIEAAALGTSALVADLPACREVLGDGAVYLDPTDRYAWENAIKNMALTDKDDAKSPRVPPDWDTHFKLVFTDGW